MEPTTKISTTEPRSYAATTNACNQCTPLGACVVFRGIEGCMPLLHGSQGCSTYIRRYMISHYREPVDVASSNFSEQATVFGGAQNLFTSLDNITNQYHPEVIGIASTCLSETIGEDLSLMTTMYLSQHPDAPALVTVSTPSYNGSHIDGFHQAVLEAVKSLAGAPSERGEHINLFPGFVSPADLRQLKTDMELFGLRYTMLPDFSVTLDNPTWSQYHKIPPGGTPVSAIRETSSAKASVALGDIFNKGLGTESELITHTHTAASWLMENFGVEAHHISLPIGIDASDRWYQLLSSLSGQAVPDSLQKERGRLVDSYIDAHKYLFGQRVLIYGEEDFAIAMAGFVSETGMIPAICASGGKSRLMKERILARTGLEDITITSDTDFERIAALARANKPDLMIGNSKGYYIARELGIPLVRAGFPVHDRIGGQRLQHLGYRGTQQLFDTITNALLESKQAHSPVGYKYY